MVQIHRGITLKVFLNIEDKLKTLASIEALLHFQPSTSHQRKRKFEKDKKIAEKLQKAKRRKTEWRGTLLGSSLHGRLITSSSLLFIPNNNCMW